VKQSTFLLRFDQGDLQTSKIKGFLERDDQM